jgi:hypothetical protein
MTLDYEILNSLLGQNITGSRVNNTALQESSRKLMNLAFPTEEAESHSLWDCFYVPLFYFGDYVTVPIAVREDVDGYTSIFLNGSPGLDIFSGEEAVNQYYFKLLEETLKFSKILRERGVEALNVPYIMRGGQVKSKHLLENVLSVEERERIEKKYDQHLESMGEITAVSRNQYLETAAIIVRTTSDGWTKGLSPEQIHRRSYGGGGSMWDVDDPDSPEEFTEWVKCGMGSGEHAFSIEGKGRHLYPPSESEPFFNFNMPSDAQRYVAMLDALMDAGVIFQATDLNQRLDLLSGESYITVNKDRSSISCFDKEHKYFPHVEWDPLVLPIWRET